MNTDFIFKTTPHNFFQHSLAIFNYQKNKVKTYQDWLLALNKLSFIPSSIEQFCFLPISFFKSHPIYNNDFSIDDKKYFLSSGTSALSRSKHWLIDETIYQQSILEHIEKIIPRIKEKTILALLPSYIENKESSLIYMVDYLMSLNFSLSHQYYKTNYQKLHQDIHHLKNEKKPILIFTVTYALVEFCKVYAGNYDGIQLINTGGTKNIDIGMNLEEIESFTKKHLAGLEYIEEYSMTELFSQAYTTSGSRYFCPSWMKVLVADIENPLSIKSSGRGQLYIIDLANINTCSFIATEDLAEVYEDGSFTILGRLQGAELRGCNQLVL
ncbi:MAG: hypothetical protein ORN85_00370 [Sediminibacterium sp.]|nr:hypothetical protein [Sediminibacterium sp.]